MDAGSRPTIFYAPKYSDIWRLILQRSAPRARSFGRIDLFLSVIEYAPTRVRDCNGNRHLPTEQFRFVDPRRGQIVRNLDRQATSESAARRWGPVAEWFAITARSGRRNRTLRFER
ncbi:hypothetical protein JMJ58_08975 [Haloterrigena salifodinae]|uniref:Uncharacterized protein n=1 Tax=Haloterrigena salifodinae TaxID=2675099 RepID=A0A8T8E5D2_9EURY|nr:hypothetical protein [Haloterrigena salifodinae]QRV16978.1 hypothetical protein JMJ58_08975 [Haloterrigena salifodinae]